MGEEELGMAHCKRCPQNLMEFSTLETADSAWPVSSAGLQRTKQGAKIKENKLEIF